MLVERAPLHPAHPIASLDSISRLRHLTHRSMPPQEDCDKDRRQALDKERPSLTLRAAFRARFFEYTYACGMSDCFRLEMRT